MSGSRPRSGAAVSVSELETSARDEKQQRDAQLAALLLPREPRKLLVLALSRSPGITPTQH